MNSTERYIAEHEKVFSLQRKVSKSREQRKLVGWSISGLIKYHTRSIRRALIAYPRELYLAKPFLKKTWSLRGTANGQRALVIGNGPSQGYLSLEQLDAFKTSGGETFCINYWPQNDRLSKHVPSWMIFSDPKTFNKDSANAQVLIQYIRDNPSIKLSVPVSIMQTLSSLDLPNEIYCFMDTELSVWKNINPIFPRGYKSMTLYKALAWAVHMSFADIGVIGMDNTYPRNLYNDPNNHICSIETHAGVDDYLIDQSLMYECVAARIDGLVTLFSHLDYFPKNIVFNLDQFSLIDSFEKIDIERFMKQQLSKGRKYCALKSI